MDAVLECIGVECACVRVHALQEAHLCAHRCCHTPQRGWRPQRADLWVCGANRVAAEELFTSRMEVSVRGVSAAVLSSLWHVIRWRRWQVWRSRMQREGWQNVRSSWCELSSSRKQRPLLYARGEPRVSYASALVTRGVMASPSELCAHPCPLKDNLALDWGAASNLFHLVGCNMPPLKTSFIVQKERGMNRNCDTRDRLQYERLWHV